METTSTFSSGLEVDSNVQASGASDGTASPTLTPMGSPSCSPSNSVPSSPSGNSPILVEGFSPPASPVRVGVTVEGSDYVLPLQELPDELLLEIFEHLPAKDQLWMGCVCRRWCGLLHQYRPRNIAIHLQVPPVVRAWHPRLSRFLPYFAAGYVVRNSPSMQSVPDYAWHIRRYTNDLLNLLLDPNANSINLTALQAMFLLIHWMVKCLQTSDDDHVQTIQVIGNIFSPLLGALPLAETEKDSERRVAAYSAIMEQFTGHPVTLPRDYPCVTLPSIRNLPLHRDLILPILANYFHHCGGFSSMIARLKSDPPIPLPYVQAMVDVVKDLTTNVRSYLSSTFINVFIPEFTEATRARLMKMATSETELTRLERRLFESIASALKVLLLSIIPVFELNAFVHNFNFDVGMLNLISRNNVWRAKGARLLGRHFSETHHLRLHRCKRPFEKTKVAKRWLQDHPVLEYLDTPWLLSDGIHVAVFMAHEGMLQPRHVDFIWNVVSQAPGMNSLWMGMNQLLATLQKETELVLHLFLLAESSSIDFIGSSPPANNNNGPNNEICPEALSFYWGLRRALKKPSVLMIWQSIQDGSRMTCANLSVSRDALRSFLVLMIEPSIETSLAAVTNQAIENLKNQTSVPQSLTLLHIILEYYRKHSLIPSSYRQTLMQHFFAALKARSSVWTPWAVGRMTPVVSCNSFSQREYDCIVLSFLNCALVRLKVAPLTSEEEQVIRQNIDPKSIKAWLDSTNSFGVHLQVIEYPFLSEALAHCLFNVVLTKSITVVDHSLLTRRLLPYFFLANTSIHMKNNAQFSIKTLPIPHADLIWTLALHHPGFDTSTESIRRHLPKFTPSNKVARLAMHTLNWIHAVCPHASKEYKLGAHLTATQVREFHIRTIMGYLKEAINAYNNPVILQDRCIKMLFKFCVLYHTSCERQKLQQSLKKKHKKKSSKSKKSKSSSSSSSKHQLSIASPLLPVIPTSAERYSPPVSPSSSSPPNTPSASGSSSSSTSFPRFPSLSRSHRSSSTPSASLSSSTSSPKSSSSLSSFLSKSGDADNPISILADHPEFFSILIELLESRTQASLDLPPPTSSSSPSSSSPLTPTELNAEPVVGVIDASAMTGDGELGTTIIAIKRANILPSDGDGHLLRRVKLGPKEMLGLLVQMISNKGASSMEKGPMQLPDEFQAQVNRELEENAVSPLVAFLPGDWLHMLYKGR